MLTQLNTSLSDFTTCCLFEIMKDLTSMEVYLALSRVQWRLNTMAVINIPWSEDEKAEYDQKDNVESIKNI